MIGMILMIQKVKIYTEKVDSGGLGYFMEGKTTTVAILCLILMMFLIFCGLLLLRFNR